MPTPGLGTADVAEDQDVSLAKDTEQPGRAAPWWRRMYAACIAVMFAPATRRQVIACGLFWVVVVVGLLALLVWLLPKIVTNGIVPLTEKLRKTLTPAQVGALLAGLLVVMPFIFVPPYPFIWLCAPLLGLWPCFAIVEASTALGMLLMFILGRTLMRHKAEQWAEKRAGLRSVFDALDRVGPFKTLVLLRLSPTPYALINYCASVPPSVSVQSFMAASMLALIPRHFLWVYFGKNLKGIAAFLRGQPMPASQIVYNVVVLTVGLILVIGLTIFAARTLRKIRLEGTQGQAPRDGSDMEAQKEDRPLATSGSSTAGSLAVGQASDNDSAGDAAAAAAAVLGAQQGAAVGAAAAGGRPAPLHPARSSVGF